MCSGTVAYKQDEIEIMLVGLSDKGMGNDVVLKCLYVKVGPCGLFAECPEVVYRRLRLIGFLVLHTL